MSISEEISETLKNSDYSKFFSIPNNYMSTSTDTSYSSYYEDELTYAKILDETSNFIQFDSNLSTISYVSSGNYISTSASNNTKWISTSVSSQEMTKDFYPPEEINHLLSGSWNTASITFHVADVGKRYATALDYPDKLPQEEYPIMGDKCPW